MIFLLKRWVNKNERYINSNEIYNKRYGKKKIIYYINFNNISNNCNSALTYQT